MAVQTTSPAVTFDEEEYFYVSESLSKCYLQTCSDLFGPAHALHRIEWYEEFEIFKAVVSVSMASLNDENKALVNYCKFTLVPMAEYHEVITRLVRELEDCYHGAGKRVTKGRQVANSIELEDAREKVYHAWKRDMAAGVATAMHGGKGAGKVERA